MTEQVDRIGQWFVDATDPTKWYGPVTKCVDGTHYCERGWNGQAWILADSGDYLRIPPKLDLPPGKRTRECRLPKEGERFEWQDVICDASADWCDAGNDDFGWRRWIVEDEPEAADAPTYAEPSLQPHEKAQYDDDDDLPVPANPTEPVSLPAGLRNMANEPTTSLSAAALMREAAGEIDRLREVIETQKAGKRTLVNRLNKRGHHIKQQADKITRLARECNDWKQCTQWVVDEVLQHTADGELMVCGSNECGGCDNDDTPPCEELCRDLAHQLERAEANARYDEVQKLTHEPDPDDTEDAK